MPHLTFRARRGMDGAGPPITVVATVPKAAALGTGYNRVCWQQETHAARGDHASRFFWVSRSNTWAVAPLNVLCELLLPLVRVGGKAVALKGPGAAAEAEAAQNALEALGGRLFAIEEVPIPGRDWAHTLAVLAKTAPTPEKYPRRAGVPEKRPL